MSESKGPWCESGEISTEVSEEVDFTEKRDGSAAKILYTIDEKLQKEICDLFAEEPEDYKALINKLWKRGAVLPERGGTIKIASGKAVLLHGMVCDLPPGEADYFLEILKEGKPEEIQEAKRQLIQEMTLDGSLVFLVRHGNEAAAATEDSASGDILQGAPDWLLLC